MKGSADLVRGLAPTSALPQGPADSLILTGATVADGALVIGGSTLGRDVAVAAGATVDHSIVFDRAQIGEGARVVNSVIGQGAIVGAWSIVEDAVIGDGAKIRYRLRVAGRRAGVARNRRPGRRNQVLRPELNLTRHAQQSSREGARLLKSCMICPMTP